MKQFELAFSFFSTVLSSSSALVSRLHLVLKEHDTADSGEEQMAVKVRVQKSEINGDSLRTVPKLKYWHTIPTVPHRRNTTSSAHASRHRALHTAQYYTLPTSQYFL
jgi:hypothetical protein